MPEGREEGAEHGDLGARWILPEGRGGRRARGGVGGGEGRGGGRDRGALGFAGDEGRREDCGMWPVSYWARWGEKVRRERCRWIRVDWTVLDP